MVDFTTLKSLDGYREAFSSVFVGMSDQDASTVIDLIGERKPCP